MSAKFIDVLPATKTSPHNELTWQPSATVRNAGLLTLDTNHRVTYLVAELAGTATVRSFCFAKTAETPGSDLEAESYTVRVGNAGQVVHCECKGFKYGKGRACKHIEAAVCILDNGWMDRDQTNPDEDVGNTEAPF